MNSLNIWNLREVKEIPHKLGSTSNDVKFNTNMKNNLTKMYSSKPIIPLTKIPVSPNYLRQWKSFL
jgi:hypothetical protein